MRLWGATLVRLLLAGVWAYAGIVKVGHPAASVDAVRAYRLLPDVLERGFGYGLPFLALMLAVLLLVGLAVRVAAAVSAAAFLLLLVALISAAARGLRIGCGCLSNGGVLAAGQGTTYPRDIAVVAVLLVLAAGLARWPASRFALDDLVRRSASGDVAGERTGPRTARPGAGSRRTADGRAGSSQAGSSGVGSARARSSRAGSSGAGSSGAGSSGAGSSRGGSSSARSSRAAEARRRQAALTASLAADREAAARRRLRLVGALAGVLLVVATGVGIGVQAARTTSGPSAQTVSLADGVKLGRPGARVTIELYEDPLCANCATLEKSAAGQLQAWIDTRTATVKYFVVSLLDSQSPSKYPSRAAAAMYCAADAGRFREYHDLLFTNPPAAGAEPTDAQLIALARRVGITEPSFGQCVTSKKYADFVSRISDQASRGGVLATPTVLVDGSPVQDVSLTGLTTAVDAAL